MYRVLIVENDAAEKAVLEQCVLRYGEEHGITFAVSWTPSALEFVEARPQADLIFMDIDMPGLTGMEAAESLREYDTTTPLVFVTNLAQYAVHGYAVDAADFIVKPVDYGSFSLRMGRVMRLLGRSAAASISVTTREGTRLFPISDLVYVSVDKHYLAYHLANDEVARARGTMREVEDTLSDQPFVRISNSELVNMGHVRGMRGDTVTLSTDEELWFSRARKKEAQERIVRFLAGGRT